MKTRDSDVPQLTKGRIGVLIGVAVVIYLVLVGIGMALTRLDDLAEIRSDELGIVTWLVERRTPTMDSVTSFTSSLADTMTVVIGAAVAFVLLRLWLGRWRESIALVVAIVGELAIFMAVTASINRDRPPVPKLDEAPPTSSFPSGHTAASVALYGTLAVLLLLRMVHRHLAVVLGILLACVPVVVALSRLYRGMHFPGDVIFGAIASATWVTVVLLVLLRPARSGRARQRPRAAA